MRAFLLTVSDSARPHDNGHSSKCMPHSNREHYTADFTQALRVQAHRTDTESTVKAEFVVCRHFSDRLPQKGVTLN